jgi:glutamate/tyrosine decarboxylase-like PLP-dependent enzyme
MSYRLLANVFNIIKQENLLAGTFPSNKKILDFHHPAELEAKLPLEIGKKGLSDDELTEILEDVTKYSVKTTHPAFYNQQFGGVDAYSVCATILSEALNTNAHIYEVAPVFMVVEKNFINYICKLFGWENGDGIFCAGASMSCMYAMMLARHKKCPDLKKTGLFGSRPIAAFASEECHYWIKKAGTWLGYGSDNIYLVETDKYGEIIPEKLEEAIQGAKAEGKIPCFVAAVAGTTVTGAYDDINALSAICQKHDLWLHIDGAWGGSAIVSKKYRHLLSGSEKADSASWNTHKMLAMSLQSSVFVTRHQNILTETLSFVAGYIFQPDKYYDRSYDLADKSIQCGRKVDAFKMWFAFKAHGEDGLSDLVTSAFDLTRYFFDMIQKREGFEVVIDKVLCTNACFWYVPPSLRGKTRDAAWYKKLDRVAPVLKEKMVKEGTLMVSYQAMENRGWVNFFRLVVTAGPPRTTKNMDFIADEIERLGKDLVIE